MPEGDTIHRAARRMHEALSGSVVVGFRSVLPQLTRVHDDDPITGRTIEAVRSVGKHLIIDLSGGLHLRTHMRMNGSWHLYRPGEKWRGRAVDVRIVISTDTFVAVGFSIPVAEFLTDPALARQEDLLKIGPDVLAPEFDLAEAARRIRSRPESEIADALLNQRLVAGIGNVFKSEILFVSEVNPFVLIEKIEEMTLQRILSNARKLMRVNVAKENRQTGRFTTGRLNPQEKLWVYSRGGSPCLRCGTAIEYRKQGKDARGTYWCPNCQPSVGRL